MDTTYRILKIAEHPELIPAAAAWFTDCWGIPEEAYIESMEESITATVPSWYVCLDGDKIVAGMGVIENDFHDRKDLAPNVCGVYTDPKYRCQGICRRLINHVCEDMAAQGISTLYLITDHTSLYERYGWQFFCTAMGDGEDTPSRIYIHTAAPSVRIETERLFLREMTPNDFDALYAVLSDKEIMQHYPYTFDEERVRSWIARNIDRYARNGFGLWAVCLKETGEMIGDCGLTLQPIMGSMLPEIGYHIRKDQQRKGYAREAAAAARDWAFTHTDYDAIYSYCKYTNRPSFRTAESIGMHYLTEYQDEVNEITHVSTLTRQEWIRMTAGGEKAGGQA